MVRFDVWNGRITDWMTPGFDVGLSIELTIGAYITRKYRVIILKDTYTHVISICMGSPF